ncbi:MAG: hypothetical protein AAFX92_06155 [Pseudomonadota bacterium]
MDAPTYQRSSSSDVCVLIGVVLIGIGIVLSVDSIFVGFPIAGVGVSFLLAGLIISAISANTEKLHSLHKTLYTMADSGQTEVAGEGVLPPVERKELTAAEIFVRRREERREAIIWLWVALLICVLVVIVLDVVDAPQLQALNDAFGPTNLEGLIGE